MTERDTRMKTATVVRPMYGIKLPPWRVILDMYLSGMRRTWVTRCLSVLI